MPGSPEGAFLNAGCLTDCVVQGRKVLRPTEGAEYVSFVDMSGGSNDDAALGIAHFSKEQNCAVLDQCVTQAGKPPFNPRKAVEKFAALLKEYRIRSVTGDRYAGETFVQDFLDHDISYRVSELTKSQLYEAIEPRINAGEIELLDHPKLTEQLLGLVMRGAKIDHLSGDHDDLANACAGAPTFALHSAHESTDLGLLVSSVELRTINEPLSETDRISWRGLGAFDNA